MSAVSRTIDDLSLGMTAACRVQVTQGMIDSYADVTGDRNPVHVDPDYAAGTRFGTCIAHGLLSASYIQVPLTELVAPGGVSVSYAFDLLAPVPAGTEIEAIAVCDGIDAERARARFRVAVRDISGGGHEVISGRADIAFPRGNKKQEGERK